MIRYRLGAALAVALGVLGAVESWLPGVVLAVVLAAWAGVGLGWRPDDHRRG